MEKQYKPVPDVECLKYHGTPEKPDIKIFVSHRIDLDSETIDNPLYIPVRCGAALDAREDVPMLGDDTGDNISEKRNTFSELTVLYWAWKNVEADYYGLNQYRRYFSFSPKHYANPGITYTADGACAQCLVEERLNKAAKKKYRLYEAEMRRQIEAHDMIVVEELDLPGALRVESEYIQMIKSPHTFVPSDFDVLKQCVLEKYPQWMDAFDEYFLHITKTRYYNCLVMRRDIFFDYCQWLFDILFEFEKRISLRGRKGKQLRAAAYMGERLTGLYIYQLIKQGRYKIKENQLVFFKKTEDQGKEADGKQNNRTEGKSILKAAFKFLFPYGSRPYVFVKKIIFRLKGIYYDPANDLAHREYTGLLDRILPMSAKRFSDMMVRMPRGGQPNSPHQLLAAACWANEIKDLHRETFLPYKYCNYGKDLVLLATGPTAAYFEPVPGVKYLGVNGALNQEKIALDYYFIIDNNAIGRSVDKVRLKELKCDKFVGNYIDNFHFYYCGSSEIFAKEIGAKKFIAEPFRDYKQINRNIEYFPLIDGFTVTTSAMHFALYTHPRRIFIVGNDASTTLGEHADGTTGGSRIFGNEIIRTYEMIKTFVEKFYPDIEIISVNPIGLRGMFRDVYTQSYLDAHPEAKRGLGRYYELLPDVINEVFEEE